MNVMLKKTVKKIKDKLKRIAFSPAFFPFSSYYYSKHIKVRGMESGIMLSLQDAIDEAILAFIPKEYGNKALRRDIVKCYFFNGKIVPEEYFIFDFPNKRSSERDAFVSRYEKDIMYSKAVGTGEKYLLLHDKYKFYSNFKEYFHRDVCLLSQTESADFIAFCEKHRQFIAKKQDGSGGFGTVVCTVEGNATELMEYLLKNGSKWVIEELINQHEEMAKLNKSSINTIRVTSYINKDGFGILDTVVRIGREGSIVDNASSGGITAYVDKETGEIITAAVDKHNGTFLQHPDNGIELIGFRIPQWKELLQTAQQVHETIPFYPCVGWDFALSENGWVLVEGNWGNLISQYILKKGLRKEFTKCFER